MAGQCPCEEWQQRLSIARQSQKWAMLGRYRVERLRQERPYQKQLFTTKQSRSKLINPSGFLHVCNYQHRNIFFFVYFGLSFLDTPRMHWQGRLGELTQCQRKSPKPSSRSLGPPNQSLHENWPSAEKSLQSYTKRWIKLQLVTSYPDGNATPRLDQEKEIN